MNLTKRLHNSSDIAKHIGFWFLLGLIITSFSNDANNDKKSNEFPFMADVFIGGEEGYHTYRIPSVITTSKGTILALCEGRASQADHAHNDIVMKKSLDKGKTWSDLEVIAEQGDNCLNNPTLVELEESNRIIMMYQVYPYGFDEHGAVPGYKKRDKVCRTYLIYSDDDGASWSAPKDITKEVKRKEIVTSTATGPGIGIQISHGTYKGRILMPFNQGPYNNWKVYAVYSDNNGKTWDMGEVAPEGSKGMGNEVQMVELTNGDILLNSRSASGNKLRKKAISKDGGETWSPLMDDPELIEPQCQASLLRFNFANNNEPGRLLFSNPASKEKRLLGTIRISYDDGKTWPLEKLIYEGSFAYSCLTKIDNSTAGLLFERDGYKKISFSIIPISWLEDK